MLKRIFQQRQFSRNMKTNAAEFQAGQLILTSKPTWMQIEPTTLCNLHCMMCREKIANKEWGRMADPEVFAQIYASGWLQYVELLELNGWGETFLHPQIPRFLKQCTEFKQMTIGITTNGLLLNQNDLLGILCRLPRLNLTFSIDSADAMTYERIRRGGSWERLTRTLQALNRMIDQTRSRLMKHCDCLVNRLNVGSLEEMVDFALEYGFDLLNFLRVHDCPELEVPDDIALPAMEKASTYAQRRTVNCFTYEKYSNKTQRGTVDSKGMIWRCERPWQHLMIRLDGNVVPCCYLCGYKCKAQMGNCIEKPLPEIWNSENYIRLRKSMLSEYLHFCDVGIDGCRAKNSFIPNVLAPT